MPNTHEEQQPTAYVAIGGSAGGLNAYQAFFGNMLADSGLAFIVVSHLDPNHESQLAEILARTTEMPVAEVTEPTRARANQVYLIPPNHYLSIRGGVLDIEVRPQHATVPMAIDHFFKSLAEDQGRRGIGIVMSGNETDGSQGLEAIREAGGMTLAQAPETAEFDGMPRSAIRGRMVDRILPPQQMPDAVIQYACHGYTLAGEDHEQAVSDDEASWTSILALLRVRHRHDFSFYKPGTIARRIARRMGLRQVADQKDYLKLLREDGEEADRLLDDLLIGVTSFYRTPEAFEYLQKEVLPHIIATSSKRPGERIRIWVPGCSSGQEAYSLAIAFMEALAATESRCSLQVFATDIDDQALESARAGIYPETIAADVTPERLERWFDWQDHHYVVKKQLREMVLFAPQNLLSDPPFSRLDLISCRNLLIYLNTQAQQQALSLFGFALEPGGYLFLGSSEGLGPSGEGFDTLSRKYRIYQRRNQSNRLPVGLQSGAPFFHSRAPMAAVGPVSRLPVKAPALADSVQRILLRELTPACVVTNAQFDVLYVHGENSDFLQLASGAPSLNLLEMARRGLRTALREVVATVLADDHLFIRREARMQREHRYYPVEITARRFTPEGYDEACVLLCLRKLDQVPADGGENDADRSHVEGEDLTAQLEQELKHARSVLQSTIEELDTSNEELRAAHEEAMSMNEELQSSNEELETSKEELQSMNEELTTVNTELEEKVESQQITQDDIENLLLSTDIATLFLDTECRIKRYTPPATELFRLIISDVGRNIGDIADRFGQELDLTVEVGRVVRSGQSIVAEIQRVDGAWYQRRVSPYRHASGAIGGAVVTFSDITAIKQASQALADSERRFRALYDDNPTMCVSLNEHGSVESINRFGLQLLGLEPTLIIGHSFAQLHREPEIVSAELARCYAQEGEVQLWEAQLETRAETPAIWLRCSARWLDESGKRPASFLIVCEDVTHERQLRKRLEYHASHDELTGLVNRREFETVLDRVIQTAQTTQIEHALCFIDLDNFKTVNDTQGHQAGDELLTQVTRRLLQAGRKRDLLARMGGDEFAVLMEHCNAEEAKRGADALRDALRDYEFVWHDVRIRIGCCVGVVPVTAASGDASTVLRTADTACALAKESGSNSIHVYNEDDATLALRQSEMGWANHLRRALAEDRIEAYVQPIVNLQNGDAVCAFEALARLRDEQGEIWTPGAFMSAAARYGLLGELDRVMAKRVLDYMKVNPQCLAPDQWMSINISGNSLVNADFTRFLSRAIPDSGVDPRQLCFEITETSVISNMNQASDFVTSIRKLGCRFAIDDFGAGLASFHYLKSLPVDQIKIDGSFVIDMLKDPGDRAILDSINEISHLRGKITIAEWVETQAIADALREMGVDYAQGFHYARPAPIAKVLAPSTR